VQAAVVDEEKPPGLFHFARPRFGLGTSFEMRSETRSGPYINTKDSSREFREWLELEETGSVYAPGLFAYTLNVRPEWAQRLDKHEGDPNRPDSPDNGYQNLFLPRYLTRLSFLKTKPYNLTLFAKRSENPITSAFTGITDTRTDSYGADVNYENSFFPAAFNYWHSDVTQEGFYDSREVGDDLVLNLTRRRAGNSTTIRGAYRDKTRTANGNETNVTSASGNIWNSRDFSTNEKYMLISGLNFQKTDTDTLRSTFLNWSENFIARHSEEWESRYWLRHDENRYEGFDRNSNSLEAQLKNVFRKKLTTTLSGKGQYDNFTDGSEKSFGGKLDFDYRTDIPWGSFRALVSHGYTLKYRNNVAALVPVTDQLTLTLTQWTFLSQTNVDQASIAVTNLNGSIVYVNGLDYNVDRVGGLTRINRTPFGGIADGQAVLVSYRFESNPSYDDGIFSQHYEAGVNLWNRLFLSYSFYRQQDDVLSGTPPDTLSNRVSQVVRLRYEWGPSDTQLSFEDTDESYGVSSTTWRVDQALRFRLNDSFFLLLSGYYGDRAIKDPKDDEKFYGFRSRVEWALFENGRFSLEGFLDKISGRYEDSTNQGLQAALEVFSGIWKGRINYAYVDEEDTKALESRTYQTLYVEISRDLW
ncbi:MAG: hypothetical protein AB1921_00155, partial [Thermodesulfobacteriota bacterium]